MRTDVLPNVLTASLRERLSTVAVATIVGRLQTQHGIRSTFFTGLRPLCPQMSLVGRARTLRYAAMREDRSRTIESAQRKLIECIEPGDVILIEARGVPDAGTIGDLLAGRAFYRGAAGIVTDGGLRDTPAVAALKRPVYYLSSHAAFLTRHHMALCMDEPITCAGVYVEPGDIVVGDAEGAAIIPAALAERVAREAISQELEERFAAARIAAGESTVGLFPLTDARRADFKHWLSTQPNHGWTD